MTGRRKVIAKFADGTEVTRTSQSRVYTHAWLSYGARPDPGPNWSAESRADRTWRMGGFSASAEQAQKNMTAETAFIRNNSAKGFTVEFAEVVAVDVVARAQEVA